MIGRLFKFLFVLAVIAGIGLIGYAYLADLDPVQERVTEPVELELSG